MRRKRTIVTVAAMLIVAVTGVALVLRHDGEYDRSFDSRVPDPAYPVNGPTVLYDEGHLNVHTARAGYRPFADLVRNDGYALRVTEQEMTERELEGVDVLVIALARGRNETNDDPAYTDAEAMVVERWIRAGGSLLLITDHWPHGSAVAAFARRLGVDVGTGIVQDPAHHDAGRGDTHVLFSAENGLLRDHPVTRGRSDSERVRRVLTFTGNSVQGPPGGSAFLVLSDSATERPPGVPTVRRDGGDVVVSLEYGDATSAAGRAQGLAFELDAGRVVVLGDAGMLRAQRGKNGLNVGMNVPDYDNRQLALNIMHWLSRAL